MKNILSRNQKEKKDGEDKKQKKKKLKKRWVLAYIQAGPVRQCNCIILFIYFSIGDEKETELYNDSVLLVDTPHHTTTKGQRSELN